MYEQLEEIKKRQTNPQQILIIHNYDKDMLHKIELEKNWIKTLFSNLKPS